MPPSSWKQYKRDHPDYMKRQRQLDKVRADARRELSLNHVEEYRAIYARLIRERKLDKKKKKG